MGSGSSKSESTERDDPVITVPSVDYLNKKLEEYKICGYLVVIDFTGSWCGPCKRMEPIFHDFAKEFLDVKFLTVDIDDFSEILKDYNVESYPTFVLLKHGKEVGKVVGANRDELRKMIEKMKDD